MKNLRRQFALGLLVFALSWLMGRAAPGAPTNSPLNPWPPRLLEAAEGRDLELQIALSSGLIHRKSKR